MPINQSDDEKQMLLLIQRHLAKALRLSVESVTQERLPHRMVMLLLRLALAQTVRGMIGKPSEGRDSIISGAKEARDTK